MRKMKKKIRKCLKKKSGFTLIEMVIVLFIVGILMLLIIPNVAKQHESAQAKGDQAIVEMVQSQERMYMIDNSTKTKPSIDTLVSDGYITAQQKTAYEEAAKNDD